MNQRSWWLHTRDRVCRTLNMAMMVFLIATAVMLPVGSKAADKIPFLSSHSKILAFGDSLTSGIGGSGDSYPLRLSQRINREVINAGVPGDTTSSGLARLPGVLRADPPQLMILCLGINDFLRGVAREHVRGNLLAILALARKEKIPVLLLAVPQPGATNADPIFSEVAAIGGASLDDQSMVTVLNNPLLKGDLIHPNGEGYRRIADNVVRVLGVAGALSADP